MRRSKAHPVETVFVFGAGASKAEGAPLQRDLFVDYFNRSRRGELDHEMDRELATFFEAFFGINVDEAPLNKVDFPTFEEVLGTIEIAIQRVESFRGFELAPDNPRLQRIREHLIFLICDILDRALEGKAIHHQRLIQELSRSKELLRTGFISFNYDIMIDNALTAAWDECDIDYGLNFTNYETEDDWHKPREGRSVHLLKLHGSLNWLYCPTCTALTLTPKQKSVTDLIYAPHVRQCSCGCRLAPIIIPPTFFKVLSNFHLQQVWRAAEGILMEAKRVVFCGYSLPDADMHVRYLLKRVEVNRQNAPDIFVVNHYKDKSGGETNSEIGRYLRYFRDPRKLHFKNMSFEDLCSNGLSALEKAPELRRAFRT